MTHCEHMRSIHAEMRRYRISMDDVHRTANAMVRDGADPDAPDLLPDAALECIERADLGRERGRIP